MQTETLPTSNKPSVLLPMAIIGTLFFIFGFITWLNSALVPFLQIVCDLNEVEAIMIASTFYFAYVVMALPMSYILDKIGYRPSMSLGLVMMAVGCLLYIPAAQAQTFAIFLVAQFILGSGLTILQTASNPYVVKVGPEETAAVRISIMGILNKFAGFLAPMIFSALVLGDFSNVTPQAIAALSEAERQVQIESMANGLIVPYIGMAIALVVLAAGLFKSGLPELDLTAETTEVTEESATGSATSVWHFPHLILGVATLFVYVGVEVIAGDAIGLFGNRLNLPNATVLGSYTMAFMVIGYIVGLLVIPRLVTQRTALAISAVLGISLSIGIVYADSTQFTIASVLWGWTGADLVPDTIALIALLGFANAIVWPAVWPLALQGLGRFTAQGSALLIMGIAGGAVLPLVYSAISEAFDPQSAYWMMLPCYLFIFYYALIGSKVSR